MERFIALKEASESHKQTLKNIWENKENEIFPVVIMEDDVFRKKKFTKHWNQMLDLKDCDCVAFDAFHLKFKSDQMIHDPHFVPLSEHGAMGALLGTIVVPRGRHRTAFPRCRERLIFFFGHVSV